MKIKQEIELDADDIEIDNDTVTIYGTHEDMDIGIRIPLEDIEAALLPYRRDFMYDTEE